MKRVWNSRDWWKEGNIEMYDTSTTRGDTVVIKDPLDGKLYSISSEDGENVDLWAKNGLTPDLIARLIIGLTTKDPILGGVMDYLDSFVKRGITVEEARRKLTNALKIIEGPGSAEFGKDQPDPPR
jgi:hypothetical protein